MCVCVCVCVVAAVVGGCDDHDHFLLHNTLFIGHLTEWVQGPKISHESYNTSHKLH